MGRESGQQIHASSFLLSYAQLLRLLFFDLVPFAASLAIDHSNGVQPPMFTPPNGGRPQEAKAVARLAVNGVQWVDARGTFLLINLQPGEFVFFSCYATAGLMLLVSSFLFTLLEFYGIQL
jgi:hypothetical protein